MGYNSKYTGAEVEGFLEKAKDAATSTYVDQQINPLSKNVSDISIEVEALKNATYKNKGYFKTFFDLTEAYPTASAGSKAYVGLNYPYAIYLWNVENNTWEDSGEVGGEDNVNFDNYYTKEETRIIIEEQYEILSQEEYNNLEVKENKLYFCY